MTLLVEGLNKAAETNGRIVADGMRDTAATLGQALKDSATKHGMWVGGLICFGTVASAVIPLLKACPK